jgi:hypothetical protein
MRIVRSIACILCLAAAIAFYLPAAAQRPGSRWWLDRMVLGVYGPVPANHTNFIAARESGFKIIVPGSADCLPIAREDLLLVIVKDARFSATDGKVLNDPEQRKKLDTLMNRLGQSGAFYGYYLAENVRATDFAALGKMVAYLRKNDPDHFSFISLLPITASPNEWGAPTYEEYLDRFVTTVDPDFLCFHIVPFVRDGDAAIYLKNLAIVRQKALESKMPFAVIVRVGTAGARKRSVTAKQLRWLAGAALAYGARGVTFEPYWGTPATGGILVKGDRTELHEAAKELNQAMISMTGNILYVISQGAYHVGPAFPEGERLPPDCVVQDVSGGSFIVGVFQGEKGRRVALVCNADWERSTLAQVRLREPVGQVMEMKLDKGLWRGLQVIRRPGEPGIAMVPLTFKPGEVRLLDLR